MCSCAHLQDVARYTGVRHREVCQEQQAGAYKPYMSWDLRTITWTLFLKATLSSRHWTYNTNIYT
jgi:hypothetical protein